MAKAADQSTTWMQTRIGPPHWMPLDQAVELLFAAWGDFAFALSALHAALASGQLRSGVIRAPIWYVKGSIRRQIPEREQRFTVTNPGTFWPQFEIHQVSEHTLNQDWRSQRVTAGIRVVWTKTPTGDEPPIFWLVSEDPEEPPLVEMPEWVLGRWLFFVWKDDLDTLLSPSAGVEPLPAPPLPQLRGRQEKRLMHSLNEICPNGSWRRLPGDAVKAKLSEDGAALAVPEPTFNRFLRKLKLPN